MRTAAHGGGRGRRGARDYGAGWANPRPAVQPPLPANPLAGNAVAQQEGRTLFVQYNCSGCHGGHGGGGMGPSLRDPVWIYSGRTRRFLIPLPKAGRKGCRHGEAKIPQEEIWQLVAYIKSMRTPQEPQAPTPRRRRPSDALPPLWKCDRPPGLFKWAFACEIP